MPRYDIESAPSFNFNPLHGIYETLDLTCQQWYILHSHIRRILEVSNTFVEITALVAKHRTPAHI